MYLVIVATLSLSTWNVNTSTWGNQIAHISGSVAMTNLHGSQFPYSPHTTIKVTITSHL
jgi:hypothetical protein